MVCNEQLVLGRVLAECDMWVEEEVEEEEGEEEQEEKEEEEVEEEEGEEEEGREEQHDNCDTRPVQSAELHFQKFRKQQEQRSGRRCPGFLHIQLLSELRTSRTLAFPG